jgi:hypothetical protein
MCALNDGLTKKDILVSLGFFVIASPLMLPLLIAIGLCKAASKLGEALTELADYSKEWLDKGWEILVCARFLNQVQDKFATLKKQRDVAEQRALIAECDRDFAQRDFLELKAAKEDAE